MAYHIFRDIDRDKLTAIMHRNGKPHKVGRYHGGSRPSLDDFALTSALELFEFFQELRLDLMSFFKRACNWLFIFSFFRTA
jgi:hypothetical protein